MPSRGTYQIANREEGKQAQRDQSYRSCILALLIFFFLCIVLILATVPWKRSYGSSYEYADEEESLTAPHHGIHEDTTKSITEGTTKSVTERTTESTTEDITEIVEYVTNEQNVKFEKQPFGRYSNNATTTERTEEPETTSNTATSNSNKYTTVHETKNDTSKTFIVNIDEFTTTETSATVESSAKSSDEFASVTLEPAITRITSVLYNAITTESSTTENATMENPSTENVNITDLTLTTRKYTTETVSDTSHTSGMQNDVMVDSTDSTEVTEEYQSVNGTYDSTRIYNVTTMTFVTGSTANVETESSIKNETESTTEPSTTPLLMNATEKNVVTRTDESSTTQTTMITNKLVSSTTHASMTTTGLLLSTNLPSEKEVCMSGECKQLASKMLFYMNHTIDPCEDFYEYACGGFEASEETIEHDLESIVYERIGKQMHKENHQNKTSLFAKYYDSCIQYENINKTERIRLAKEELYRVGKFYTTADWAQSRTNVTELFAKLLLHHRPFLFDISPDVNEYRPNEFTLKIGPTIYEDPFETSEERDPCFADELKREAEHVDLGELYKEYKTCKNDTKEFMRSINESLTELGVFDELNIPYNISQYIQMTVINIDFEMVQRYFANYPSKNKIREAYLMKNYTYITVRRLQDEHKIVNWTQLIFLLTNKMIMENAKLQVYFHNELKKGLHNLEEFSKRSPMELHNALLGLYARNLYHEFVVSKHRDIKKHCLRVATNLLIPEASSMYMSSFTERELAHMNDTIHTLFGELTETLKMKLKEIEWTAEEGRRMLTRKVNDLKVVVPDISYLNDSKSNYQQCNADKVNLTDNYFENSMMLMRRYRTLMYYEELFKNPRGSEQIWTHYATPFQSKGLAIYGLNLVIIPFGAVDSSMRYNQTMFDYLLLARLGNTIAHQIAHHFDAKGIYYWNGSRDDEYSILNDNDSATSNFEEYINCHNDVLYGKPRSMLLPTTGQTVSYQIPQLTLNERLSEGMGLRLAYDTLDRLRSKEVYLPWLKLEFDQLFYLAYAQMHCTKSPLTSSYISLYEDEQLPSRIRIFVAASNDKLLGEAWNCPAGSSIVPSYTCSIFPYLSHKDAAVESE